MIFGGWFGAVRSFFFFHHAGNTNIAFCVVSGAVLLCEDGDSRHLLICVYDM